MQRLQTVCGRARCFVVGLTCRAFAHLSGTEDISCCVVPGGLGCGWTVVQELPAAIELAHSRSYARCAAQGDVHGGQSVRLTGLSARPELNGEIGIAMRFTESSGRWLVRLKDGEGKQIKPTNLEARGPAHGIVHCVWGDAQVRVAGSGVWP